MNSLLSCLFPGPELSWPPEVGTWSEPDVRRRDIGSPAARSVRRCHAGAATIHPGDPHQNADLPDQTQAGLLSHGHRHQVATRIRAKFKKFSFITWQSYK